MSDRSVQLNLSQTGTGADAVVVDGQNLSGAVRRVLLTSQVGEPPTLVLELAPRAFLVDADGAQVGVSPVGEHILTQLGWRPPVEPAEAARATEAQDSEANVPGYVHALLDAWLTGQPLNFSRRAVPDQVRARLDDALAAGVLTGVPAEVAAGLWCNAVQPSALCSDAEQQRAAYADALDAIATAVEAGTDDTLRSGIRSILRRYRPEALEIWSELRASRQPEPPAEDKPEMVPLLGHGGGHSRVPARPPRAQGSLATARQLLDQAIDDALPLAGGRVRELLAALRRELARVDAIRSTAPPTG